MSEGKADRYEPIAVSAESTVVAEFISGAHRRRRTSPRPSSKRSSSSSCSRRPTSTCRSRARPT